ncbi:RICIN domain-containing protein [Streptomyces sp. NPDC057638]|uniref:RICIN domain-containing protein n=1 Tax=Streptomyces sp. NPDC057638 TaxID=3346190 RepID=UPI00368E0AD4
MGRAGRPQGDPKGATTQSNALARFLCEITDGVTVRELGERYRTSKTIWSEYRSGIKIIPWHRLEKIVTDHVRDARGRAALLAKARHLHTEASEAEQGRRPPAATTAAQAQRQAETDLAHAEKLAQALLRIIATLQEQLTGTTAPSANATPAAASAPATDLGPDTHGARERLRQAQAKLTRVEEIRTTAQEVQATAHEQYLNAVAPMTALPSTETPGPTRTAPLPAPRGDIDLEIRLTRLHSDVQAEHQKVAALWGQISRLPMDPIAVLGEVLGRADNPPTSANADSGSPVSRRGRWPGRILTTLAIVTVATSATAGTILYLKPESSRHDIADPPHTPITTPTAPAPATPAAQTPTPTTSPPERAASSPSGRRTQTSPHTPDPARTPSPSPKRSTPETVAADPPLATWSNGNTNKCLQVDSGAMVNGAGIVQWPCNAEFWQQWRATVGGTLTTITNHNSGKCLEIRGGGMADGAGAVQWECNGETWQQWRATRNSDGSYRITNHNSGKCLEIHGGGTADGAGAVQWQCNGELWQKWW